MFNTNKYILITDKQYVIVFLIIIFGLTQSLAQHVMPTVKVDRNNIRLGEQIHMQLKLRCNAADTVDWPTIGDTLTKEIEVLDRSKLDTTYDQNDISTKIQTQNFVITSFDSGYFAIPPFYVVVNGTVLETEPLLIEVHTVAVDTSKGIADIKGPISAGMTWVDWLKLYGPWVGGGLVAIVALIWGFLYWKKNRKTPVQIIRSKPKTPPHIIALNKLEQLKEKKLWQAEKAKLYHIELSEIIREYLEHRFFVNALEQTTPEIMQGMRTAEITDEQRTKLNQLLTLSDLVKFAKEKPIASENEGVMHSALEFVNQTIPKTTPITQQISEPA